MIGYTALSKLSEDERLDTSKRRKYEVCLWHMVMHFFEADMRIIEIPEGLHDRR